MNRTTRPRIDIHKSGISCRESYKVRSSHDLILETLFGLKYWEFPVRSRILIKFIFWASLPTTIKVEFQYSLIVQSPIKSMRMIQKVSMKNDFPRIFDFFSFFRFSSQAIKTCTQSPVSKTTFIFELFERFWKEPKAWKLEIHRLLIFRIVEGISLIAGCLIKRIKLTWGFYLLQFIDQPIYADFPSHADEWWKGFLT